MKSMKKIVGIMLLVLVTSLGTPLAFAGPGEVAGRSGPGEVAGRTSAGPTETPGVTADGVAESPGIMALILNYLAVML